MDECEDQCGKCDIDISVTQRSVTCSTCSLKFHTRCVKVSDAKYEMLKEEDTGILWFCRSCIRTTSNMIQHLANMKIRLNEVEAQRLKDHEEIQSITQKLADIEKTLSVVQSEKDEDLNSLREMVGDMLEDFPQNALRSCQPGYEETAQQVDNNCAAIQALELRMESIDEFKVGNNIFQNSTDLPDRTLAAVANEIEERNKRKRSVVLHNVPETYNASQDSKAVASIIQEVTGTAIEFDKLNDNPRIYRLGQQSTSRGRARSVKVHFKTTEDCDKVLLNVRKLSRSAKHSSIIIQPDMTPMQRKHLRILVSEKRRRNNLAVVNNEDPDWTISAGYLHRRTQYQ